MIPLEPGDRLSPKPGAELGGRQLYGSKWVVDHVGTDRATLQRYDIDSSRRRDEFLEIRIDDLDQFHVTSTDEFWSDYESEGGYRIL